MPSLDVPSMTPILLPTLLAEQLSAAELAGLVRRHLVTKADYARRGVSYDGLTSVVLPPLVEPARVRFRDVQTGQWLEGVSEPKIDPNHFRIDLDVRAYAPCRHQSHWDRACGCKKKLTGIREGPANLCTSVFANFVRTGILGTNTTITDATGTGRALTKTLDGGVNSLLGCAGTGATAAVIADTNLQTQTETQASVTVNTVTGSGASGSWTVTYTVTAASARNYTEVGIKSITTTTSWNFLVTRDTFAALSVSSAGTLAVTYTFTHS